MFNKRIHSHSFCLPGIAALALITATGAAPQPTGTAIKPRYGALVIRRPEVIRIRRAMHHPFRPAQPPRIEIPIRLPKSVLFTGFSESAGQYSLPEIDWSGDFRLEESCRAHPVGWASGKPGSRENDRRISFRDEMVSFDDLDNGRYGALAARNGPGKQDIGGFMHIPAVWGEQLQPYRGDGYYYFGSGMPPLTGLVEGVSRFTEVRAEAASPIYLSSQNLLRMPFLFINSSNAFELTPTERENLGRYLRNGGFVFADNGTPQYENSAAEASLRQMFRDALGSNARFEPIPASHPLYHCFFDFRDGPPLCKEVEMQDTDQAR
ncbi:MAG: DUF4159 domain-containing protein, partial [Candidatus Latescibacterota bacterium]